MNAYYKLYVNSVFRLATSLVIKSSVTASRMNDRLISLGKPVDLNAPATWKYYLNLAGQYHAADEMMTVISLDTREVINFTIDTLKIHRQTRREYTFGSDYYKALKARYPDQTLLIGGIINPIDIATAIESKDHNILSYDKALVEPTEQHLIPGLQRFIDLLFVRWQNQDYDLFEPWYYVMLLAGLGSLLAPEILNLRKSAAKTDQAHSYHIRQYLLSFSPVGKEFDYLTQKQKLYLQRNIKFLNRNIGSEEIREELTQKMLTDRGFSLARYDVEHNYADMPLKALDPEIRLNRTTLNGIVPASGSDTKTVAEMLDLELPMARDNPLHWDEAHADANWTMQNSLFNSLPTKVLESSVVDLTDSQPYTLTDVLLNHWIYLSHFNYFKSVIVFTNPANGDKYNLSVKDAFIFYLYAYNAANSIVLKKIPTISANRVRRIPAATWKELRDRADKKRVPDYYIDKIIDDQVALEPYISTEAFREACVKVHGVMLAHRDMRLYNQDYIAEGELHKIIDRCYMDIRIPLGGNAYYQDWLDEKGIDISAMGRVEFSLIATEIFKVSTGGDLGIQTTTRQIHAAMIRIMRELSPYSVQYIPQINDNPIKVIDGKFPTLTIPKTNFKTYTDVEAVLPIIQDVDSRESVHQQVPVCPVQVHYHTTVEQADYAVPVEALVTYRSIHDKYQAAEIVLPKMVMLDPESVDISALTWTGLGGYLPIPNKSLGDLVDNKTLVGYEQLTETRRQALLRP